MSTCGAEWDDEGKATIYADGHTGSGRISGISPHTAMYFAVILARNARAKGASWPVSFHDDPWETAAVDALKTALGERSPDQPDPMQEKQVDMDEVGRSLDLLRSRLQSALDLVGDLDATFTL